MGLYCSKIPAPAEAFSFLAVAALLGATAMPAERDKAKERFTAAWEDGSRTGGDEVRPWHSTDSQPLLAGRGLLDRSRPAAWIQDNTLGPAKDPEAYVELWGGDRLPGRVSDCRPAATVAQQALPPLLTVIPDESLLDRPGGGTRAAVSVPLRWVRRIVWQHAAARYLPSALFYRDGRQIVYRSIRLAEGSVRLLREQGIEEVPLAAIAELHLPPADPWDLYFEQLAVLAPEGNERLTQWETAAGLRVTASTARFQADRAPADDDPTHWFHMLQPVWSLEPLWVRHRQVRLRRYWPPHQVLLSCIAPSAVRRQADLSSAWQWQADRNVQGGRLQSAGQTYPSGFGVHASCDLEFALPAAARSLRSRFGLDNVAGEGGCVRPSVLLTAGGQSKSLYQAPLMIGSARLLDTDWLPMDRPTDRAVALVLRVDAVQDNRPAGADPLDVRDVFDWLDPTLRLDEEALRAEVLRRGPRLLTAWQDWTVTSGQTPGATLVSHWIAQPVERSHYRLAVAARGGPVTVSRRVRPGAAADRLLLSVSRPDTAPPSRIEVLLNGNSAVQFDVPVRPTGPLPPPREISLATYADQSLSIEIVQRSPDRRAVVFWDQLDLRARE
jgi:hypothetical protein